MCKRSTEKICGKVEAKLQLFITLSVDWGNFYAPTSKPRLSLDIGLDFKKVKDVPVLN
jgi:hypothetical protein